MTGVRVIVKEVPDAGRWRVLLRRLGTGTWWGVGYDFLSEPRARQVAGTLQAEINADTETEAVR